MKNIGNEMFVVKPLTLVVRGALVMMCAGAPALTMAQAADQTIDQILRPTNFVEIGVAGVGQDSTKFGEYNGMEKSGGVLIGNFSVKGGNAGAGGDGVRRWEVNGADIGTTSRSLDAKIGDQGQWSLGVGYDELRHYTAGPFKTPLVGNAGSNNFTIPAGFGALNANPGPRNLTPVQQSFMRTVDDLYSGRKKYNLTAGYIFDNNWAVNFEFNRLRQDGAKLTSAGTQAVAQNGAGAAAAVAGAVTGEAVMTVMTPTEYRTDTVKLSLDWKGDNGHLSGGYFGSFFRDDYIGYSFTSPFVGAAGAANGTAWAGYTNNMSTAPDNTFHQLNLSGGYTFRPATKLTGGLSYGRNTQNDTFSVDSTLLAWGLSPRNSLDGLVKTTHANLKVVDKSIQDLTLSAGFKYNKRDNASPSNVYNFFDINHTTLRSIANLPYSNKKAQFELAGDYKLSKDQNLRLSYERENIDRWCNQLAQTVTMAGNQNGNNPTGTTNCVVYPHSSEDKLNLGYKFKVADGLTFKAGYLWATRQTDENHMAVGPVGATSVTTGGQAYVNNGDFPGFKPFFEAQRKEQGIKVGANWDANEKLSISADGRLSKVRYPDSAYGTQNGETAGLNLDSTYAYSESTTFSAYYSRFLRTRFMHDTTVPNGTTNFQLASVQQGWNSKLTDNETAFGITGKWGGLMGNKLDLKADLAWSLGAYAQLTENLYTPNCGTAAVLTCGYLPEVTTSIIRFKLDGEYKLDKVSSIRLGYLFQRVMNNDYIYNIYQYANTPNSVMPTDQLAPRYTVNVLSASYMYSFK